MHGTIDPYCAFEFIPMIETLTSVTSIYMLASKLISGVNLSDIEALKLCMYCMHALYRRPLPYARFIQLLGCGVYNII